MQKEYIEGAHKQCTHITSIQCGERQKHTGHISFLTNLFITETQTAFTHIHTLPLISAGMCSNKVS